MKNGIFKILAGTAFGFGMAIALKKFIESDNGKETKKMICEKYSELSKKIKEMMSQETEMAKNLKKAIESFSGGRGMDPEKIKKITEETYRLWDSLK